MANLVPLNYSHGLNFKGVPNVTPKRRYKGGKKKEYKVVGWGIFALMLYIIDNIV